MASKFSSGARKEAERIVAGMRSLGAYVVDGKRTVHTVFENANASLVPVKVESDVSQGPTIQEYKR